MNRSALNRCIGIFALAVSAGACSHQLPPLSDTSSFTKSEKLVLSVREFVQEGDVWDPNSKFWGVSRQGPRSHSVNDRYVCITQADVAKVMGDVEFEIYDPVTPILRDYGPNSPADNRPRRAWFEHGKMVYEAVGKNAMNVGFFFNEFFCVQKILIWQLKNRLIEKDS